MNIKKLLIEGAIAGSIFAMTAGAAFAAPNQPNYNENQKNCFGQDRAAGVHAITGKVWGDIASDRAGDNAQINHDYMEFCQLP